MCAQGTPICFGLLHALRLEADPNAGTAGTWLTINGLGGAGALVRAPAELFGSHVAPPGEPSLWPYEQALLEALARVNREPLEAEQLLSFLPAPERAACMGLLTELSRSISEDLVTRLKGLGWKPENRTATM